MTDLSLASSFQFLISASFQFLFPLFPLLHLQLKTKN
jgi:hypothetical protein